MRVIPNTDLIPPVSIYSKSMKKSAGRKSGREEIFFFLEANHYNPPPSPQLVPAYGQNSDTL